MYKMSTYSIFHPQFSTILSQYVGRPPLPPPVTYEKPVLLQHIETGDFDAIQTLLRYDLVTQCYDTKGKSLTDYMIMKYTMPPDQKVAVWRAAAWRRRRHAILARSLSIDNNDQRTH
jgi:hypothetical protein